MRRDEEWAGRWRAIMAVVFDFDGTLARVDLDFDAMRSRVLALAVSMGLDMGGAAGNGFASLPVLELVEEAAAGIARERGAMAAEAFCRNAQRLIRGMERSAAENGELFPWVRESMRALADAGIRVGVVTRNCRHAVLGVFPDILEHCGVFLSRDDVERVKPHPDHVLAALAVLGAEPGRSVMVGDHFLDVETGHRAGMVTAGVASGRIAKEELCAAGADMAAPDGSVLVRMLTSGDGPEDAACSESVRKRAG